MALTDTTPAARTTPSSTAKRRAAARGEQLLVPSNLASARSFGANSCSCTRSPRAIAHWMLEHAEPPVAVTELALDREEASLWSHALTGRLRIEHTAVDGCCSIELAYTDGRRVRIAMDELRLAAVAAS